MDAVLEALRHTVGRDHHMPHFLELVQHQVGPITYAEIAHAFDAANLEGGPEWQQGRDDLIATLCAPLDPLPSGRGCWRAVRTNRPRFASLR